jgi:hypothetical protein
MVRFQPITTSSSSSSSEDEAVQDQRSARTGRSQPASRQVKGKQQSSQYPTDSEEEDDADDDDIQLPLRGGRTPQASAAARKAQQVQRRYEEEDMEAEEQQDDGGEEYKNDMEDDADDSREEPQQPAYVSRHSMSRKAPLSAAAAAEQRKLQLMDEVLMDEDEEAIRQEIIRQQNAQDAAEFAQESVPTEPRSFFAAPPRRVRAQSLPRSAMKRFLASVPPYQRPASVADYMPGNPLVATAAAPAQPASSRSVLDFMQHSFRAGWSSNHATLFFADGIDGALLNQTQIGLLAVDLGSEANEAGSLVEKKQIAQAALETHLAFHSAGVAVPSSATVFCANPSTPFGFGQQSFGSAGANPANSHTPFTRLLDAHLTSLRSLPSSPSASLASSTYTLLRTLYSVEEAESRAPKLSRACEKGLREGANAREREDLSIVTAREDPYATTVGRESAFEQGWLQPSVRADYVVKRLRQLEQQAAPGSDGVTGSRMQQVIAHLIGHDLIGAVESSILAGNFRLATLLAQLDSFNYSGRLGPDGQAMLESSQHDISRQLALWQSKERGLGAYIPEEIETIYRLMSGDVLIEPALGWMECLGLEYWYAQPKSLHTNLHHALLNYKRHALLERKVGRPFPAYDGYVEVERRRGGNGSNGAARGVLEDEEDEDMGASSQALIVQSDAPPRSAIEYYDIRFGLLDLYTEQSRRLDVVLSPQSHTPHVLDHNLSWHIHALLQSTPLSQFGPRVAQLHMNYVHQIELLSTPGDDFWRWAIFVALAATFPSNEWSFDRSQLVKEILSRHVTYDSEKPFDLPTANGSQGGGNNGANAFAVAQGGQLPKSLPLLQLDDHSNVFATTLLHSAGAAEDQQEWFGAAQRRPAVEEFLLQRCGIPVEWVCECKAVSAAYQQAYSSACFYYLHAQDWTAAYRIYHTHLQSLWVLAIINAAESSGSVLPTASSSPLESSLLSLLHLFSAHSSSLQANWSTSGGGLVREWMEFRRNFGQNVQHFTHAGSEASSIADRDQRVNNFARHRAELRDFLRRVDALSASLDGRDTTSAVERLAWSKMSGSVLQQLHALQPLERDMLSRSPSASLSPSAIPAAAAAVEGSEGSLIASADRLAVVEDWKDEWLKQFA